MLEPTGMPTKRRRGGQWLHDTWQKYGLIVIGNVVFFALLYFVQYRPNSRENRASELLTLAQHEETDQRFEAAESIYTMLSSEYADERPALVAKERLPKVRAQIQQRREVQAQLPAACTPSIDMKALLEQRPSLFVAELLAGQFPSVEPVQRDRYFGLLDGYVWLALNRDQVPLAKFQDSASFRANELRQRYLIPKATARYVTDWVWDDFKVRSQAYYTLHNVVITLNLTQAGNSKRGSIRVAELAPEAEIGVLEFNVKKKGGTIYVQGTVESDEGKVEWQQRL